MRLLFTFVGGNGHLQPLLPIATAAQAAGHTVAVAGRPTLSRTISEAGFAALPTGPILGDTGERRPLLPLDQEREERDLREGFVRHAARERATAIAAHCAEWQPDVIVCDEVDFGGMIAAERLGIPYASVLVIAAGSFIREDVVGEALDEVRAEHGLPPDPSLRMLSRHLVLSPIPPGLRDPAFPLPPTAHSIRPMTPSPPTGENAVHVTLGTVFNVESGDLFPRVLAGLRDLPVPVIVTVGDQIDPAELGPQPSNVHIGQYIPQPEVLPRCAAVISHAGSGSVIGALAHGLPMVLIPMGADQPLNAARCAELGVARMLDPIAATPSGIRAALDTVLGDPGYRQAAQRIQRDTGALPGPEHAVTLLEALY